METSIPAQGVLADTLFHHAVEQSAIAIAITDANASVLYVNPAYCNITGYAASEVIGRNQSLLSYRKTPKSVYRELWAALAAGKSWSGRLLNRRKDGTPYIAELTVTPVLTPGDPLGDVHYLGMHRDVTEEHRQACLLLNSKQLIESVVSVAPIAFALMVGNTEVVLDNPAYRKLAGDLGVKEPAVLVIDTLKKSMGESFKHAFAHRRPLIAQEVHFQRPGGDDRWYHCSVSWFEEHSSSPDSFYGDATRDYMLLVLHDITTLRRQEEALRMSVMREHLSATELTDALRESLSAAVFQLQGPVNLIAVAAGLQRRRLGPGTNDPLLQALEEARIAGENAITTLRDTIPPEPVIAVSPVNLNEVIRDVLMLETSSLLAAGVTVDWQPARVLPVMMGSGEALRSLFRQLVTNAVEAMNLKGWSARNLLIRSASREGRVEIEVCDSGPGIPDHLRLKVFEPFFSTKKGGRGTRGMGLSMVQEIVSRHRGVIFIDSGYTGGCRIMLNFPVRSETTVELETFK